ncbi:FHA domain-containing protein [Glaciibacter flavus]|uniref:FHA domain-containing protein n=1 Tax=Orlajensenia flava TaxID=2565934 RepID=A0A4S4FT08_9MICO|nr:FHA domain-containing protein [Glaciibacter flavus]THG32666.1 FHA domain-containing protein [Glaciibacter flavus]
MSELTLLVLRLGFLALLWAFVFAVVYALRTDLFGQRVRKVVATPPGGIPVSPAPPVAAATAAPTGPVTAARPSVAPSSGKGELATSENARAIVVTSGAKAGAEFPLGRDEITIGRSSDSAIVIRDDYTSTHHARLMLWNNGWMLQDLDSTNGTFLDGHRVTVPTPVALGSSVKVGATTFELRR